MTGCLHCGQSVADDRDDGEPVFCCSGCAGAYRLVRGLGLDGYYARRTLDPAARPMQPEDAPVAVDLAGLTEILTDGTARLHLMVDGIQCGACVWLIESVLSRQPGLIHGRVNMTTRRLVLRWRPGEVDAGALIGVVGRLGYHVAPYDPRRLGRSDTDAERDLLRAMAVAGFASANVMIISVGVWAGLVEDMGPATRTLMYWFSALIALPALAWSIRPFLRSALGALASGHTNMDVPIVIGVTLTAAISVFETINGGRHAYFDSAITLLFFLLIGRYLDRRARGRARSAAEHLLSLGAVAVTVINADGRIEVVPPERVQVGAIVLVAVGERLPMDGRVIDGVSDLDTSLITGESVPAPVRPGESVFAGTLNLTAALRLEVTAVGESTLLAEIVRLMEVAGQSRARHVAIADRVSRLYAPVVHGAALFTFLGWVFLAGMAWHEATLIAVSVLIITCPCALALAVPVVQVLASGRLLRRGVLLKSATALERMAAVDTVAFDKTGTLTVGRPDLIGQGIQPEALRLAAALAGTSRHPLARALVRVAPGVPVATGVREVPGSGLALDTPEGEIRLGSRRFVGVDAEDQISSPLPELWLARPGVAPSRFTFLDQPRFDSTDVVAQLKDMGLGVVLLSGDRAASVLAVAEATGIQDWWAELDPVGKTERLQALADAGRRVLMVGDGLNDAPALATAWVSMSPAVAADVSQTAADAVFQGERLAPVAEALVVARFAERLVRQNFLIAIAYNLVTVPLAIAGLVTPLIAAASMSISSIAVIVNALRLSRKVGIKENTHGRIASVDVRGARSWPARPDRVSMGA